jgi:putative ABC transport system permease protein
MAIPIAYNLRNLKVRKTTTLMTALGIALTVAVLLASLALVNGLAATLSASGDPLRILVMRKGSTAELSSVMTRPQFQDLKFKPGIAAGKDGQPLASLEVLTVINLASVESPSGTNLTIRGLMPQGIEMRGSVRLARGRWFDPSRKEIVIGKSVEKRFADAQLGRKLRFGRSDWEIVGVMDAGRGSIDSEVWGDLNQVASDLDRAEAPSCAFVQATDAVAANALVNSIATDQRLGMDAMAESAYFAQQTQGAQPIEYAGKFVAIIMAIGSSFAAMNTMYAAVARRSREIGTLRVLGFSRGSILLSFFLESVLLAVLGGILGCLLVLPLNGITTAVGNLNFSETAFDLRVTPQIMLYGLAFAILLGTLGGLLPARQASRKEILTALREV